MKFGELRLARWHRALLGGIVGPRERVRDAGREKTAIADHTFECTFVAQMCAIGF